MGAEAREGPNMRPERAARAKIWGAWEAIVRGFF